MYGICVWNRIRMRDLAIELHLSFDAILQQLVQLLHGSFGGRQEIVHLLDAALLQRTQQNTDFGTVALRVQHMQAGAAGFGVHVAVRGLRQWRDANVTRENERFVHGLVGIRCCREPMACDRRCATAVDVDGHHLTGRRRQAARVGITDGGGRIAQQAEHVQQSERRARRCGRRGGNGTAAGVVDAEDDGKVERVLNERKRCAEYVTCVVVLCCIFRMFLPIRSTESNR